MRNSIDDEPDAFPAPRSASLLARACLAAVAMADRLSAPLTEKTAARKARRARGSLSATPTLPPFRLMASKMNRSRPAIAQLAHGDDLGGGLLLRFGGRQVGAPALFNVAEFPD